jgi:hypothetical protein
MSTGLDGNLRAAEKLGDPGSGSSVGDAAGERDFARSTGFMDARRSHFGLGLLLTSNEDRGESSDASDSVGDLSNVEIGPVCDGRRLWSTNGGPSDGSL